MIDETYIDYDPTDHFRIMCRPCKHEMNVTSVSTETGKFDGVKKPKLNCTRLTCRCEKCKNFALRKIYWS